MNKFLVFLLGLVVTFGLLAPDQLALGSGGAYGGCRVNDEGVQLVPSKTSVGCVCPGLERAHTCRPEPNTGSGGGGGSGVGSGGISGEQVTKECQDAKAKLENAGLVWRATKGMILLAQENLDDAQSKKKIILDEIKSNKKQKQDYLNRGLIGQANVQQILIDEGYSDLKTVNEAIEIFKKALQGTIDNERMASAEYDRLSNELKQKKHCQKTSLHYDTSLSPLTSVENQVGSQMNDFSFDNGLNEEEEQEKEEEERQEEIEQDTDECPEGTTLVDGLDCVPISGGEEDAADEEDTEDEEEQERQEEIEEDVDECDLDPDDPWCASLREE